METCCNCRTKTREEKEFTDLITRLNKIEGQVRGIRNMVEDIRQGNEEAVDELCRVIQKLMK